LVAAPVAAVGFAAEAGEQLPPLNGQKPVILVIASASKWGWTGYSAIVPTLP